MVRLASPLIDNHELAKLREIDAEGFKSCTIDALFFADGTGKDLESALKEVFKSADEAIADGNNILILTDRGINRHQAAIPTLLLMGGLHHHLVKAGTRTRVSIILETGEAREVHHFAVLLGYGADAINPYMVFETLHQMIEDKMLEIEFEKAVYQFL
jgi:glutamate synthase (ferredoxin)